MNHLLPRQSPDASCWSRAASMWPPLPIRAARSWDSAILNRMACPVCCRYRIAEAELSGFTKAETPARRNGPGAADPARHVSVGRRVIVPLAERHLLRREP